MKYPIGRTVYTCLNSNRRYIKGESEVVIVNYCHYPNTPEFYEVRFKNNARLWLKETEFRATSMFWHRNKHDAKTCSNCIELKAEARADAQIKSWSLKVMITALVSMLLIIMIAMLASGVVG